MNFAKLVLMNALDYEWRVRLMPGLPMSNSDLAAMWLGRPKEKPLPLRSHGIYAFDMSGRFGNFVHLNPSLYRPIDWRGLL